MNIADVDNAKMGARAKIRKAMKDHSDRYNRPYAKTLLLQAVVNMTPEQKAALRETNPALYSAILAAFGGKK